MPGGPPLPLAGNLVYVMPQQVLPVAAEATFVAVPAGRDAAAVHVDYGAAAAAWAGSVAVADAVDGDSAGEASPVAMPVEIDAAAVDADSAASEAPSVAVPFGH